MPPRLLHSNGILYAHFIWRTGCVVNDQFGEVIQKWPSHCVDSATLEFQRISNNLFVFHKIEFCRNFFLVYCLPYVEATFLR